MAEEPTFTTWQPHTIHLNLRIADTHTSITLQGQPYNPDILDDLTNRLLKTFTTATTHATNNGYTFTTPETDDDTDTDDDDE